MPTKPTQEAKQETHTARSAQVLAVCPDGHETELEVAPMIAQIGSSTGERCLKPAIIGGGACDQYLKVKQVIDRSPISFSAASFESER